MSGVFVQVGSLLSMIALGYALRRAQVLKDGDPAILMKLIMNGTLPAAVIAGFDGFERDMGLIFVMVLAILMNALMSLAGYLAGRRDGREESAFGVINYSGYNVGAFAIPCLQGFLGGAGIMVACVFDTGNAVMCSGLVYVLAARVLEGGGRLDVRKTAARLVRVVPFDVYLIMLALYVLDIHLPAFLYRAAGAMGNANTFLSMLVIGASIRLRFPEGDGKRIVRNLTVRYVMAAVLSLGIYYLLPLDLLVRQVLVILACAPVSSITVINTAKCGLDEKRAGAVNSLSIAVSLVIITTLAGIWRLGT